MQEFKGKVAVITGAASGSGDGIACRCAQAGMKVVLADVEDGALAKAEQDLRATGAEVLAVHTDVSRLADVEALARQTLAAFGGVHLLFNNAGVGAGFTIWDTSLADWQWVIGVNLWGVIYGLHVFVPIMLAQGSEGHIVNTASIAGLLPYHPAAPYQVTKFAVVGLSENLYQSLAAMHAKIKTSVLCPGWVNTRILNSGRNRPAEYPDASAGQPASPEALAIFEQMRQAVESGMTPAEVAEHVFKAIRAEQFYILPHQEYNPVLQKRMEDILQQRNPE